MHLIFQLRRGLCVVDVHQAVQDGDENLGAVGSLFSRVYECMRGGIYALDFG